MSEFNVGDIVKTRDGQEVEILKVDATGDCPIIGCFLATGMPCNWPLDGRWLGPVRESDMDLILPKRTREVTVWVNVYPNNDVMQRLGYAESIHATEYAAEHAAGHNALAVAVKHTFTLEY